MKISITPYGIAVSQIYYVVKVIEKFKICNMNKCNDPFRDHVVFHVNTNNVKQELDFCQIIERLMYLMNCTMPGIAYLVSTLR